MGFNDCFQLNAIEMRCRRSNVTFLGRGPYEAAIDIAGGDEQGGFRRVVLWHDRDQYAVYAIGNEFEKRGWDYCSTYSKDRADQGIYTHEGARFRDSLDLSYHDKRRVRLLPISEASSGAASCIGSATTSDWSLVGNS